MNLNYFYLMQVHMPTTDELHVHKKNKKKKRIAHMPNNFLKAKVEIKCVLIFKKLKGFLRF